jgi:2-isopropylmalate synthase
MCLTEKLRLWELLLKVRFKQIEVGSPATSHADFDFIRELIERNLIPEHVTIQVLLEPYAPQVARTFDAIKGAKRVALHLCTPTPLIQHEHGFGPEQDDVRQMVIQSARRIREKATHYPQIKWQFQYSTQSYSSINAADAVAICNEILHEWLPTGYPVVINLPATVERCSPNQFADQVEWFCHHINHRNDFCLSIHTHNDRGCAVAAAEMALLAGADRVEGTLLGNGERSGNMDIVTLAMNLHSQGVDHGLNLANIDEVSAVVSECTHMPVHPRHPYAGELAFSSNSNHQSQITRGLHRQPLNAKPWNVAYLPIDPTDLGRNYAKLAKTSKNSGKGGICYLLEQYFGLQLPRWLQDSFTRLVEHYEEALEIQFTTEAIIKLFRDTYLVKEHYQIEYLNVSHERQGLLQMTLTTPDGLIELNGHGHSALSALRDAWQRWCGLPIEILAYSEHMIESGNDSDIAAYVRLRSGCCTVGGVAIGTDTLITSMQAFIAATTQGELISA